MALLLRKRVSFREHRELQHEGTEHTRTGGYSQDNLCGVAYAAHLPPEVAEAWRLAHGPCALCPSRI